LQTLRELHRELSAFKLLHEPSRAPGRIRKVMGVSQVSDCAEFECSYMFGCGFPEYAFDCSECPMSVEYEPKSSQTRTSKPPTEPSKNDGVMIEPTPEENSQPEPYLEAKEPPERKPEVEVMTNMTLQRNSAMKERRPREGSLEDALEKYLASSPEDVPQKQVSFNPKDAVDFSTLEHILSPRRTVLHEEQNTEHVWLKAVHPIVYNAVNVAVRKTKLSRNEVLFRMTHTGVGLIFRAVGLQVTTMKALHERIDASCAEDYERQQVKKGVFRI
jgi:hypothetical protein